MCVCFHPFLTHVEKYVLAGGARARMKLLKKIISRKNIFWARALNKNIINKYILLESHRGVLYDQNIVSLTTQLKPRAINTKAKRPQGFRDFNKRLHGGVKDNIS